MSFRFSNTPFQPWGRQLPQRPVRFVRDALRWIPDLSWKGLEDLTVVQLKQSKVLRWQEGQRIQLRERANTIKTEQWLKGGMSCWPGKEMSSNGSVVSCHFQMWKSSFPCYYNYLVISPYKGKDRFNQVYFIATGRNLLWQVRSSLSFSLQK